MSRSRKRRTRKHRRFHKQRAKNWKVRPRHTLPGGRTGTLHHKKRASIRDGLARRTKGES